jgi:hypothetical protein
MGVKDQFNSIKNNWLIVLIVLIIVLVFMMNSCTSGSLLRSSMDIDTASYGGQYESAGNYLSKSTGGMYTPSPYNPSPDFAPQVKERKITKTTSITNKVERGTFAEAEMQLKAIVTSTDSFLLNENVHSQGSNKQQYKVGSYSLKVPTDKYDAVISQLKQIGKVTNFNENSQDITGSYTNTQIELDVEKARLARYEQMYGQATLVADKITLNDQMFNQERTIKYYEEALANMNQRIEYSTVQVSLQEEQSPYSRITFVTFPTLVLNFTQSVNSLFHLISFVLPYALAIGIIILIVHLFKKKK